MSGQVQRLARRLGLDPDTLATKIDPDTIRRTKYPVVEKLDSQGRREFSHDPGIEEGSHALR